MVDGDDGEDLNEGSGVFFPAYVLKSLLRYIINNSLFIKPLQFSQHIGSCVFIFSQAQGVLSALYYISCLNRVYISNSD